MSDCSPLQFLLCNTIQRRIKKNFFFYIDVLKECLSSDMSHRKETQTKNNSALTQQASVRYRKRTIFQMDDDQADGNDVDDIIDQYRSTAKKTCLKKTFNDLDNL